MNRILYLTTILFLVLCAACKAPDEDIYSVDYITNQYSDSPVFFLKSSDGQLDIEAGISDFYVFTGFEEVSTALYSYFANFQKLSTCSENCEESFFISISDFQERETASNINISQVFEQADYNFSIEANSFSRIFISYIDEDGAVYQSDLFEQPEDSFFEIQDQENYLLNENNFKTQRLTINFQCTLWNEANAEALLLENVEAVIAVAYPE